MSDVNGQYIKNMITTFIKHILHKFQVTLYMYALSTCVIIHMYIIYFSYHGYTCVSMFTTNGYICFYIDQVKNKVLHCNIMLQGLPYKDYVGNIVVEVPGVRNSLRN